MSSFLKILAHLDEEVLGLHLGPVEEADGKLAGLHLLGKDLDAVTVPTPATNVADCGYSRN